MKKLIVIYLLISALSAAAQDTLQIQKIDSIVANINLSSFTIQKDSTIQDLPEMGLKLEKYLTAVFDGTHLKKYVNMVNSTTVRDGTAQQLKTINTFYYQNDQLIKVEELAVTNGQEMKMDWYYNEDQPLYWTLKTEKAPDRAAFLLNLGKTLLSSVSNAK